MNNHVHPIFRSILNNVVKHSVPEQPKKPNTIRATKRLLRVVTKEVE